MVRKASVLLLATLFAAACASTDPDDPNAKAIGGAIGASEGHRMDQQQKELQQIPGVEVTRPSPNEIDINLTNDILFDYNSFALRQESKSTLQNLADNFRRYPEEQIGVEGHTD